MDNTRLQDIKRRYNIVGNCDALNRALDVALQVAPTDLSVLVVGESGVGKEIIPRIIHDNSPRKAEKYFAINCGSIPSGTIDSELFGHEAGAFTGAIGQSEGYFGIANKGTIFLDEVGEMPLATQARLLRVLETGEYIRVGGQKIMKTDVRIVAATNVNMQKAIKEGRFREDLYYRLNTIPVQMPALRDRGEDIYLLFRLFALQMAEKYHMPKIAITPEAKNVLTNYKWPGNVRELKNITEQMSVLAPSREIDAEMMHQFIPFEQESTELSLIGSKDNTYASEREMLVHALVELKGNMDSLSAEVKSLRRQLDEQRALSGAEGFNTHTDISEYTPKEEKPTKTSNALEFLEAEEVKDGDAVPAEPSLNLRTMNKQALIKVLEKHNNNRKEAARELGISDRTLYRRLNEFGLK